MAEAEDDDVPTLPADTLALVEAFKREQAEREQQALEGEALPDEDWQLSQFWYSDETAGRLCTEIEAALFGKDEASGGEEGEGSSKSVALVSTPTLLPFVKKLESFASGRLLVRLFEYDARFGLLHPAEFVPFDYRTPAQIPPELRGSFSMVVADPPFLSDECLLGTAQAIRLLSAEKAKLILCTGAVMEERVSRLLSARRLSSFRPQHAANLANDFAAYANYEPTSL